MPHFLLPMLVRQLHCDDGQTRRMEAMDHLESPGKEPIGEGVMKK